MNEAIARCLEIEDPGAFREALLECVDAIRCGPDDLSELVLDLGRLEWRVDGPEKRAACRAARERVAFAAEAVEAREWSRAASRAIVEGDGAIVETLNRLGGRLIRPCSSKFRRELHGVQDQLRGFLGEDWRKKGQKAPEYVPTPAQIAEAAAIERAAWTPEVERERRLGRANAVPPIHAFVDPIRRLRTSAELRRRA